PVEASMLFVAGSTATVSIQPSPEWVGWIRSQPALQKKIELPTTRRHPPAPNTKRDLSHRFECWIYLDGISPEMAIHALVDWNGHAVLPGQKSPVPDRAKLDLFTVEGRAALRLEMSSIESGRITICIPGLPRKSLDLGEDIAAVSVD